MAALTPLLQSLWQEPIGVAAQLIFFLFIPLFLLLLKHRSTRVRNLKLPPSPPKLPIIGNLHQIGTFPHRSLRSLSNKYGPIMLLRLGSVPTLVVSSPEMVKEMMKTNDVVFSNHARPTSVDISFNGGQDLVFSPYGEYWRQLRKICVQELLSHHRVQSQQFLRDEEVDVLIQKIRRSCLDHKEKSVNLTELLLDVTNYIVCRSVLGQRYEGEGGKSRWGELSVKLVLAFPTFFFRDYFPCLGWMDELLGMMRRLEKTSKEADAFLEQAIKEQEMLKTDSSSLSHKRYFLDILLQLKANGPQSFDLNRATIKAILLDMFVGATDTSRTTMEWAMAELMRNPHIMKKAQQEIRQVVGKKSKIDANDVNHMGYFKCVIKETLRLHAPAPLLVPRETSAATRLGGYDIPHNSRVYINAWAIQRDPKVWDKAEEFIPERFEKNNLADSIDQEYKFFPFGGGRRICPGVSYGLATIEYAMANLLYWFDWELPTGVKGEDLDMSEIFGLAIQKKVPLHVVPIPYNP
ncbi:hypothetical protein I3843_11G013400 [Carya illinoinensis]|uniref:Cytochrome P450 n=2 Tax=Carya illinoinensis TaxID=32201 RepID=A0A8T1NZG5_CARIL|nr:phenylacetaldehyde oxime monooxygenase CYP71AN24-like [Carya illinoinensis]KAG6635031.1 hypothetical protein CIPAW_11G014200 [Carya illinoinensis]KAG6686370.1 hypothetical protein I3842_11G013800 [Carya illinoinensis]KAG7954379.1 hypothetical protein I3843_11G013400 [Carya illinoinensis]